MRKRADQQSHRCPWCGRALSTEFVSHEHIIPRSMGGANSFENMAVAHRPCNKKRSSNIWQDPVPGPEFDFIRKQLRILRDAERSPDGLMILRGRGSRKPAATPA